MPGDQLLRAAAAANSDGCGIMSSSGYIGKCLYDDIDEFLTKVESLPKEEEVAVHFRWATHGSVKESNCHPFTYNDFAVMHNGVLPIQSKHDKTDSQLFLSQALGPLLQIFGADSFVVKSMLDATGNRFAVLDRKRKKINIFGSWSNIDGVYYSNLRFV